MMFVGTAGWSIPRATAAAFPETGVQLERYAQVLRCAEINSSFYREHAPQTYAKWAAAAPRDFRFAVKLPRSITHDERLRRARKPLEDFLGQVRGLGKRLGPLLVQLPPSLQFEPRVAGAFFSILRGLHEGAVVCEPRHTSWLTDRADRLLDAHRIGRVGADPSPVPGAEHPGGWPGIAYYRLHGSPRRYWSTYEPEYLRALAVVLRESPRVEAWVIFDNTAGSGATKNALELQALLRHPRRAPRP